MAIDIDKMKQRKAALGRQRVETAIRSGVHKTANNVFVLFLPLMEIPLRISGSTIMWATTLVSLARRRTSVKMIH